MDEDGVLDFIKSVLPEGSYDEGVEVVSSSIEDGALLVDINGEYFAIKVEGWGSDPRLNS